MSLIKGRKIHVRQWNVLNVNESVIDRVDKLATNEGNN